MQKIGGQIGFPVFPPKIDAFFKDTRKAFFGLENPAFSVLIKLQQRCVRNLVTIGNPAGFFIVTRDC